MKQGERHGGTANFHRSTCCQYFRHQSYKNDLTLPLKNGLLKEKFPLRSSFPLGARPSVWREIFKSHSALRKKQNECRQNERR